MAAPGDCSARTTRQPPAALGARRALTSVLMLWVGAGAANAQTNPWYVGASMSLNHDSNVLRLGENQPSGPGESRSDTVLNTGLVGGINQGIGRQRVVGNLTLLDNRFDRNSKYNNQGYNGSLGLEWQTVERLSGALTLAAARNLSTFNADGVGLLSQKNEESSEGINASLSLGLVTQYSLEASAGQRRVRNSLDLQSVRARDYNQDHGSLGLAWRPSSAISLSAGLREVRGVFPRFRAVAAGFESDRFRQQQLDLAATLRPSGASTVDLRLNVGDTRYRSDEQRDFASVNGSLNWMWQATGKLRLNTRYARDKGQDNYPSTVPFFFGTLPVTLNDRRLISSWRAQIDMDVSAKVALSSSLQYSKRSVQRHTLAVSGTVALASISGSDATTIFTVGARWSPLRNSLLGCDLRSENRRASGAITANLKGNSLNCYTQITLQ